MSASMLAGFGLLGTIALVSRRRGGMGSYSTQYSKSDILPGNYWITIEGEVYNTQGSDHRDMIEVVQHLHREYNIRGRKRRRIKLYAPNGQVVASYGPGPGDQRHWNRPGGY